MFALFFDDFFLLLSVVVLLVSLAATIIIHSYTQFSTHNDTRFQYNSRT